MLPWLSSTFRTLRCSPEQVVDVGSEEIRGRKIFELPDPTVSDVRTATEICGIRSTTRVALDVDWARLPEMSTARGEADALEPRRQFLKAERS